jgi:lysophospholipase L1-like esterase
MPISKTDTVFLGDSLTAGFELQQYFPGRNVKNRGLSGDMTHEVLYRLEEVLNARPHKLFLMIGINDLFNGEDEVIIFGNIVKILEEFRVGSPETKLYLQSILPVNESIMFSDENINLMIFSLNDSLRRYCKENKVQFIDLYGHFLNTSGEMDMKYTYDGVHLSGEGYQLWAGLILHFIQE